MMTNKGSFHIYSIRKSPCALETCFGLVYIAPSQEAMEEAIMVGPYITKLICKISLFSILTLIKIICQMIAMSMDTLQSLSMVRHQRGLDGLIYTLIVEGDDGD